MTVKELVDQFDLEVVAGPNLDREVDGAYIGDLLSNVMARAEQGNLWLTVQGHQNVVAVALLVELAAVILVEDFDYEENAVQRACQKGVNLLKTRKKSYALACNFCESKI
ncbi:DRTGG domain-containing protein [Halanaerobium saccharolyticum]|uniref:DRTGG domain-containing protein n=1 Tax=Halanaerobium saccharolyticum TaxID=43595 RepID=A0A4R7Z3C1_9FIRM|nr:DRTGG domain-containing protein [Halanaerobium saccharolyticum]RAK07775.1 DRTGG domain-containing protein [Halanaerobium saccharolyticum]TDW03616.1 DRTGG domain-containing protein [Halanaerobium saccharolyticum]TDX59455.1 DRTGG domain-containing protein [Halanaerobium saccharolyticum]